MLLALTHLPAGKFVGAVVKYGLRGKASEEFEVSPDGQGQRVKVHVIVEFRWEKMDLPESFLRLQGFFLECRVAPIGDDRNQKTECDQKHYPHIFHPFNRSSQFSKGHSGKVPSSNETFHLSVIIQNLSWFATACQSPVGSFRFRLVLERGVCMVGKVMIGLCPKMRLETGRDGKDRHSVTMFGPSNDDGSTRGKPDLSVEDRCPSAEDP